jgi:hypothetical protein
LVCQQSSCKRAQGRMTDVLFPMQAAHSQTWKHAIHKQRKRHWQ